jgi:hypothetical protein
MKVGAGWRVAARRAVLGAVVGLAVGTPPWAGAASEASAVPVDRMVSGFPDLPKDARGRGAHARLRHFGGELDGTGGERDREVARTMRRLRCDRVERDLARVRARYRDDARVTGILREVDPG